MNLTTICITGSVNYGMDFKTFKDSKFLLPSGNFNNHIGCPSPW